MSEQEIIKNLLSGNDLTKSLAEELTRALFTAKTPEQFIVSSVLLLRKKGESVEELTSLVRFLRKQSRSIDVDLPYLVDFCGTGGDQKHTFNISTISALVAAGAGSYVVKHGNRSASSHCGSSDLMEHLGVRLKINPGHAEEILRKTHFVYLHAPFFHPAFSRVQPARQKLKTKTVFNFLGPLLNPAKVAQQIIGVSEPSLLEIYPKILQKLGTKHAWVIMNEEGYDEISLTGKVYAVQVQGGKIRKFIFNPADFGLKNLSPNSLVSSGLKENLEIAKNILSGRERGSKKDVVLANTALGLVASGRAYNIKEGMALARFSIESGRARHVLEKVIELQQ